MASLKNATANEIWEAWWREIFSVNNVFNYMSVPHTWLSYDFRRLMALFHCMARLGTVHFWGAFHWVHFLVPPRLRFQASRTVTKTWRVNSADHWLAGENRYCLCHWTCSTRHNRPARFKSAQPAKDRTQLSWMSVPFLNNQKMAVSLSVEEVQTVLSLLVEERIQREHDGATRN